MNSKCRFLSLFQILLSLAGIAELFAATCPNSSNPLIRSGLTCQEKKAIVKLHNQLRQAVAQGHLPNQPPARNMIELTWDDELAKKAQDLADTCIYGHDSNEGRKVDRFQVGQNIGMSWTTGPAQKKPDFEETIRAWFNEIRVYTFGNPPTKATGHYTQMAWESTSMIGCGYSYYLNGRRRTKIYVCNYGPAGNIRGYAPYETGNPSCDSTNLNFSGKYHGLCAMEGAPDNIQCD